MKRHPLSIEIGAAIGRASNDPAPGTSPDPGVATIVLCPVPASHYAVLLDLLPLANLWQVMQVAKAAWDAAPPDVRIKFDQNTVLHLRHCCDLYKKAIHGEDPNQPFGQMRMLALDTAAAGLQQIEGLRFEDASVDLIFSRLNQRIDTLSARLCDHAELATIDWRPPAIAGNPPVFHMEFGETMLELRMSVI